MTEEETFLRQVFTDHEDLAPGADGLAERARNRKSTPRWRMASVVGVAMLAVGATAASAGVFGWEDSEAPNDLQQAVNEVFTSGQCTSGAAATEGVSRAFKTLGYDGWQVVARPGADPTACVAAGILASDNTVVLVPVAGPEISSAMEGVAGELMTQCLDSDEAQSLVSSVLRNLGVESFEVSTDGPHAYPSDQMAEVLDHVREGCFVYSGSGSTPDGTLLVYLSGNDG